MMIWQRRHIPISAKGKARDMKIVRVYRCVLRLLLENSVKYINSVYLKTSSDPYTHKHTQTRTHKHIQIKNAIQYNF